MKYFLITIVIVGIGFYYWLFWPTTPIQNQEDVVVISTSTTQETEIIPEQIELDYQTYHNEEWGISFEYPNDWEIREPAFGSAVSLFNLAVEPIFEKKLPTPILVNITPKEWIEKAMIKMKNHGILFRENTVASFEAISYESTSEGLPVIGYLVLINNSYWINISGKKQYEDELNQVLESFIITPVEYSE